MVSVNTSTDGTEIKYTVKEDDITNYTSASTVISLQAFYHHQHQYREGRCSGCYMSGLTQTNPVTVHLLADGTDTERWQFRTSW